MVQMSIGHGSFVCNIPKSHIAGGLTGLRTLDTLLLCNGILLHLLSVNSVNIVQGSVCTPMSILKWHTLWTSVIQNFTNTSLFLWHINCQSQQQQFVIVFWFSVASGRAYLTPSAVINLSFADLPYHKSRRISTTHLWSYKTCCSNLSNLSAAMFSPLVSSLWPPAFLDFIVSDH